MSRMTQRVARIGARRHGYDGRRFQVRGPTFLESLPPSDLEGGRPPPRRGRGAARLETERLGAPINGALRRRARDCTTCIWGTAGST